MFVIKCPVHRVAKRRPNKNAEAALEKLSAFLDAEIPQLVEWIYTMFQSQQNAITYRELREAWLNGYEDEILKWQEDYARFVERRLVPMWGKAMQTGAAQFGFSGFVLDSSDADVKNWMRNHATEFVTNISEETRQAIRAIVMNGQSEGWDSGRLARTIRPAIGLTEPQARANARYQQHVYDTLKEINPRMKEEVALRLAQEAALRYAEKQHRYRANLIANTELATAYNQGAHESVRQAMREGLMGACVKVWSTAADSRVCPICKPLDGMKIGFDDFFGDREQNRGRGYVQLPPAHPGCRCAIYYDEISPARVNLQGGNLSGKMNSRMAQRGEDKIEWPEYDANRIITKEQYTDLRKFAANLGIALSGFKKFDGDVAPIKEAVETLAALREQFPKVADERHKLTLILSSMLDDNDFALTEGRHIYLNANAYRSLDRLTEEYQKLVDAGWFVQGTDYRAVIYHEFGHIVANIFAVNSLKIACELTKLTPIEALQFMRVHLSKYAFSYEDGSEIISEVFADISTPNPAEFSLKFHDKVLRETGGGIMNKSHTMSAKNRDAVLWADNEAWYSVDKERQRFALTPAAPKEARESFEKYKKINNLNW